VTTVTTNTSTADQINRIPFSLTMSVTPQITANGSVIMDVNLNRSFPGAQDESSGTSPINTRQANTKIMVDNGQTAVIGGIFQNDVTQSEQGLPIVKDIPIIGWLFKSKSLTRIKSELLLFLTPNIIEFSETQKMSDAKARTVLDSVKE